MIGYTFLKKGIENDVRRAFVQSCIHLIWYSCSLLMCQLFKPPADMSNSDASKLSIARVYKTITFLS